MTAPAAPVVTPRLDRLLGYLEADPANLRLIEDAAGAALEAGHPAQALALLERYAALEPLPASLRNLESLAYIEAGRFDAAALVLDALIADHPTDPNLRFNRAWCAALLNDYAAVDALLDQVSAAATPKAARLKVLALHHLGRMDEALAQGGAYLERHANDRPLAGALAQVALDAENQDLAQVYARRAGDQADGLTVLGMLCLDQARPDEAMGLFDRALEARPDEPRALLGRGLGLLARGEAGDAAPWLDHAAQRFGTHLGSWVAAAWAHFIAGDSNAARARLEHALAIDDTFAEIHGSLALLDIATGRIDEAKSRTAVALRLDRRSFSAALAKSLLLARRGEAGLAERIRQIALSQPIDARGQTLAQIMATMAIAPAHRR